MNEKKYICKYCGKQCNNGQSLGGHMVNCQNNYKKQQSHIKSSTSLLAKRVSHEVRCAKCGTPFILELTPKSLQSGKYTKYCSRSCANSRTHSVQTRSKISQSMRKFKPIQITLFCKQCGCEFSWVKKKRHLPIRKFCSRICAGLYVSRFVDHSA